MKIKTEFEVKQFIQFMSHFTNLRVINKTFINNTWQITLNNDIMYEMDLLTWEAVQDGVLTINKETMQ